MEDMSITVADTDKATGVTSLCQSLTSIFTQFSMYSIMVPSRLAIMVHKAQVFPILFLTSYLPQGLSIFTALNPPSISQKSF